MSHLEGYDALWLQGTSRAGHERPGPAGPTGDDREVINSHPTEQRGLASAVSLDTGQLEIFGDFKVWWEEDEIAGRYLSQLLILWKVFLPTVSKSYEGVKCYMAAAPGLRILGVVLDLESQEREK